MPRAKSLQDTSAIALVSLGLLFTLRTSLAQSELVDAAAAPPADTAAPHRTTEAGKRMIEEVIVTARKREESLQDVPISVSAFSAADIEGKSLNSLQDLAQFTPNFSFSNSPARTRGGGAVFIRGVGQQEADIMWEPGVGVYVDGVYIARMQGLDLDLLDLERAEVLRGPQGTLFGKNTIGGAVNLITARPTDDFHGSAEITTGRFDRLDGKLIVNVPLIPGKLAARFAGAANSRDGYGKRVDFFTDDELDEMGDVDNMTGRATFNWTPTEAVDVLFSIDARRTRETGTAHKLVATAQPGLITSLNSFVDPDFSDVFLTNDEYTTYANGPNALDLDNWGAALSVAWDFGGWGLKSITGYRDLQVLSGFDLDGSPYNIIEQVADWSQTQVSQEFQFSGRAANERLNWILGAYYFEEEAFEYKPTYVLRVLFDQAGRDLGQILRAWSDVRSYAVFGQMTYALTERLSTTAGLRYSNDEKEISIFNDSPYTGTVVTPLISRQDDWGAVSGQLSLEYRWSDDIMTYASAGRGFKSGGINSLATTSLDFLPFDPEYILTYEVGLKSEFLDRRLRFNTSVFFSDYTDMQFLVRGLDAVTARSTIFVDNAAKAEIKGVEVELNAILAQGLTFSTSIAYIDARYTDVEAGLVISEATEFVETPEWTFTASGQYTMPIGSAWSLITRLDYAYKTDIQHDITNRPIALQEDFGVLNGRLSFNSADETWAVSLFGTNLTDETYLQGGLDLRESVGFATVQYARPREWGLSFRYSF